MIALALAAAATALHPHQQALVDCMTRNAVELGAGNNEPVQSVFHAAESRCRAEWDEAGMVWRGNARVRDALGKRPVNDEEQDRALVYTYVFGAVVEARATRR